jgi:hypothetical protein
MLIERQETIGGWIALAIFFGILLVGSMRSHEPPQAPQVKVQQHSADSVKGQDSAAKAPTALEDESRKQQSGNPGHDDSEADIFGIKRGDSGVFGQDGVVGQSPPCGRGQRKASVALKWVRGQPFDD